MSEQLTAFTLENYINSAQFQELAQAQQELLQTTQTLLQVTENQPIVDYAFLVFPVSKAYEGFLKDFLLEFGLISPEVYRSRRFRLGRALNPDVHNEQRDKHWFFDDVSRLCGEELARQIWQTWLECRNHVFHYFPGKEEIMNREQAMACVNMTVETIASAQSALDQFIRNKR
jgi:hypothetical protein